MVSPSEERLARWQIEKIFLVSCFFRAHRAYLQKKGDDRLKGLGCEDGCLSELDSERLTKVEERAKSNTRRLDRLEKLIDEVHQQNEHMARLVAELKFTNRELASHDRRLREIENQPRKNVNMLIGALITAIVTAIIGGISALLL